MSWVTTLRKKNKYLLIVIVATFLGIANDASLKEAISIIAS